MKPTKVLITAVLTLLISMTAQAQSSDPDERWAGEDKVVLRLPDSSQTVTIGLQCKDADKCFSWEGPHMVSDSFQAVVTVNPQDSVSIYTVRRIDKCGEEIRQIKVTMTDTVSLVSVTPLTCYNHGDSINLGDFKIVTSPPGYENLVKVSPLIASHSGSLSTAIASQDLTFTLEHNKHKSTQKVEVTVINDNLYATASISPDFLTFKKTLEEAETYLRKAQLLKIGLNIAAPPVCAFDTSFNFDLTLPRSTNYCCNGVIIDAMNIMSPSISGSISYECSFPSAWSLPYVGGVYFTLGVGAGITFGPFAVRYRGACTEASVPVELFIEFSGGVRAQALNKDFLSLSGKIVGTAKTGIEWIIGKKLEWTGVVVDVSLQSEIKVIGLLSIKGTYPLGSWTFFK